ncbi:MAG: aldehyde dehydrogenase family protein [Kiritimatiellae bacterium]|nr:aldehyde dehydrogenase family protein [Kiritimatiellia bacterium]
MQEKVCLNHINGEWKPSRATKLIESKNPADLREILGHIQASNVDDVNEAIAAAQNAFDGWHKLSAKDRAALLKKALALLNEQRTEIARWVTMENGKTLRESLAEVDSAIWEMEFQINEGIRAFGETFPAANPGMLAFTRRDPLGVVALITPWNFPVNVACRKATPALMAGNTVIFKPASLTSIAGAHIARIFTEAGLPRGVFNFITGSGREIGQALVSNRAIKAVSFTGSTEVGMGIQQMAVINNTRTQLEMGGKNPIVVFADANIGQAAADAARAAYACAGQWCTSTSRAIVEDSIHDAFVEQVLAEVQKIRVGPGLDETSTMGPVTGETQLKSILAYIDQGIREGAKLLAGGRRSSAENLKNGCFVLPTVFDQVTADMTIAREEIFGPVLAVMRVKSFEDAIRLANNTQYGLASSIYTMDLAKALRFIEETQVGLTHVNMMTAYKEPPLPFGGIKYSGSPIPEAGKSGIEFFSIKKAVYVNYLQ